MLAAQLGHRHTPFGLPQDRDDLSLCVSTCLHSKSPRSSCRENSTYADPYFQGGLPFPSNRMKQDLALRALNRAIAIRRPPPGCIHHTDRGSQYCAHDHQKLLRKQVLTPSMSGKGNCYDNSAVESFFKSLKAELVWRRNRQTRRKVEVAIFEYINGFYNPRRKHSALGWKSPVAFEQRAA